MYMSAGVESAVFSLSLPDTKHLQRVISIQAFGFLCIVLYIQ